MYVHEVFSYRSFLCSLSTREDAARLSESHRSYTFDLDTLDNSPGVSEGARYSVDAYKHGSSLIISPRADPD